VALSYSQSVNETSVGSTNSIALSQYEWPQIQGDSSSARFSSGPAPESADILWKTTITGIQSYAAAFNGEVFVTTPTQVIALDEDTGNIIWETTVKGLDQCSAVYKINGTYLVAGTECLNIETGKVVWTSADFSTGSSPFAAGCYSPEEKMFYTETNSSVTAWNFSDPSNPPTIAWQTYVTGAADNAASVQYGEGEVFPGSFDSQQIALDANNGSILWDTQTKASMLFAGSYSDGEFFRGGAQDDTFYCFNAANGTIMWTFNPGTPDGYWGSGSAVAYGMVYALNKDGYLYALNVTNGDVVWSYQSSSLYLPGYPVVADGKVYATTGEDAAVDPITGEPAASEFACLDAFTGELIWTLPVQAFSPQDSVAIAYGNLYLIPGYIEEGQMSSYRTLDQIWALGTMPWGNYLGDSQHIATGHSGPTNLTLLWSFTASGAVTSSLCAADGLIYFGSQDTYFYCLNARTGDLIWKFKTGDPIESSPATANGAVYVVSDDGYIYSLDAENGSLLWLKYIGSDYAAVFNSVQIVRSSPTILGDSIYVGSVDGNLYCLNADTGTTNWVYNTQGVVTSSPAVDNGAVYIASQESTNGELYKLSADNGTLIWQTALSYIDQSTGTDMDASPVVADGMVYISCNHLAYYGIDATTGNVDWTYLCTEGGSLIDTPIYLNGELYLSDGSFLVCLNATNGAPVWDVPVNATSFVSLTYADSKFYLADDLRTIYVLNATDGSKISWFLAGSNFLSSPAIYEGRLYVGNQDWAVYCFANYAASSSSLTLNLGSNNVLLNDLVTGWGQLTPGLSNATITVTLTSPNGTSTNLEAATNGESSFTFTFQPNLVGTWTVDAKWLSDWSFFTSTTSGPVSLHVQIPPTPTPTETPNATQTPSPTPISTPSPTEPPFSKQTFAGIPLLYVYSIMVAALIVLIFIAASFYKRISKKAVAA
jgi:outer membrane protein assembly factor BamB